MQAGSDLVLLWTWRTCLILAGVALSIAFGLAFKRWLEERARARKVARRREVDRLVQALLASPLEFSPKSVPPLAKGYEPALFSVALDILRVTRGRDAERMLALIAAWNLRPYVERVLAGGKRSRQIRALSLLSHLRDPESLELLLRHVDHPSVYVQLAALRGLAERGEAAHVPRAVQALSGSRETNVPMLADILRRFGEPAAPAVAELAMSPRAAFGVRLAAVGALGGIGALGSLEPLARLADDPAAGVRVAALDALAKLGDPRAEAAVVRALSDPEARARAAAARAAGLLGLRGALPALADALEDGTWEVRYRAADALYTLGAPGVAVLRAAAAGETPGAEMCAELLAEKEGIPA
jgi:HEAT repeat protein